MNATRGYSMAVRGQKAEATRQRILEAARDQFDVRRSGFTLDQVAAAAGVSVQTVLRAFDSKEGLVLEAIGTFRSEVPDRSTVPTSVAEAVALVVADYEVIGDRVIWMLAEEHRVNGFAEAAAEGRQRHRAWVEAAFARWLAELRPAAREPSVLALLGALDVYVWKLYRRDLDLSRSETEAVMERLVQGALTCNEGG